MARVGRNGVIPIARPGNTNRQWQRLLSVTERTIYKGSALAGPVPPNLRPDFLPVQVHINGIEKIASRNLFAHGIEVAANDDDDFIVDELSPVSSLEEVTLRAKLRLIRQAQGNPERSNQ